MLHDMGRDVTDYRPSLYAFYDARALLPSLFRGTSTLTIAFCTPGSRRTIPAIAPPPLPFSLPLARS